MSSLDQPTSGEDGPQSSTATSPSLLRRVKKDDAAAWDRLVGLYAPLVYHWCRRADLPEQEIADVFQDVFQAVATHIADFRRDGANDTFRGWLRVITRNKVHDHFRKLGREPGGAGGTEAQLLFAQLPEQSPVGDDSDEVTMDRGLFRRALDQIQGEFEERHVAGVLADRGRGPPHRRGRPRTRDVTWRRPRREVARAPPTPRGVERDPVGSQSGVSASITQ